MAEPIRLEGNLCWEIGIIQQNKHDNIVCGDHVVFSREDDRVRIVLSDGLGSGIQANIASTLTSIPANAFRNASSLKGIDIPASVTEIGNDAFRGCTNIKSLVIHYQLIQDIYIIINYHLFCTVGFI